MALIFNIVWFILIGWWNSLAFLLLGGIFAITIIGIPIAQALFQFAILNAFPFGKEIIRETELEGPDNVSSVKKCFQFILNAVWFPFGLVFSIIFLVAGLLAFISIVGIPVGVVCVKMGQFLLFPIGAKVVTQKQAYASAATNEIEKRNRN